MSLLLSVKAPIFSSNNMYFSANNSAIHKTDDYSIWKNSVCSALKKIKKEGCKNFDGYYDVRLYFFSHKEFTSFDVDNCIKPIIDCLVSSGIVVDDSMIRSVYASKKSRQGNDKIVIEIFMKKKKENEHGSS